MGGIVFSRPLYLYALGAFERVIAVDNSSREYIPETKNLLTVGARNALNAKGILSLKSTLAILGAGSVPPQIFDQLRNAGIGVLTSNYTIETVKQNSHFDCPLIVWRDS